MTDLHKKEIEIQVKLDQVVENFLKSLHFPVI